MMYFLLHVLILLAVLVGGSLFLEEMIQSSETAYDFTDFLESLFLYTEPAQRPDIPQIKLILYFSIILFSVYILILNSFGGNRKYRSLIILRYRSKCRYYWHNVWRIWVNGVWMVAFIIGTLLICAMAYSIQIAPAADGIRQLLLFGLNMQLFYFAIGLLNFFCTLRFKDSASILACLSVSSLLMTFDANQPKLAVIVFGDLSRLLIGGALLSAVALLSMAVMRIVVKRTDLL